MLNETSTSFFESARNATVNFFNGIWGSSSTNVTEVAKEVIEKCPKGANAVGEAIADSTLGEALYEGAAQVAASLKENAFEIGVGAAGVIALGAVSYGVYRCYGNKNKAPVTPTPTPAASTPEANQAQKETTPASTPESVTPEESRPATPENAQAATDVVANKIAAIVDAPITDSTEIKVPSTDSSNDAEQHAADKPRRSRRNRPGSSGNISE